MRNQAVLVFAALVLSATAAAAQSGCGARVNSLGSDNATAGGNAKAPSKAITNPCSTMYRDGANVRRQEKRKYPGAVVHH